MIRATGIMQEGQPYLTKIEDQNGKTITINSSTKVSEFLSPSQLIPSGLAGCMLMTVKGVCFTKKVPYRDVTVTVDMETGDGHTAFTVDIEIDSDADPEVLEEIKKEAFAGCYVKGILTSDITVSRK